MLLAEHSLLDLVITKHLISDAEGMQRCVVSAQRMTSLLKSSPPFSGEC